MCTDIVMVNKRQQTRWGSESAASKLHGFTLSITGAMTREQIETYAQLVRIEEITQKLKIDDIVPTDRHSRSPSPGPIYDSAGRRINTRYRRHWEKLENERHSLVQQVSRIIPRYRAPEGYRYNHMTIREKVYIPDKQFPEFNFIGQLLGPRGRSLSDMNTRSGANIVIRGRGSTKEGRRGHRHPLTNEENEPLHCLVTADSQEKIDKAKKLVDAVIETVITTPEHANERKKEQLRDLARANGTFRDDEGRGMVTSTITNSHAQVICRVCGNGGHIARDCSDRRAKTTTTPWRNDNQLPPWRLRSADGEQAITDTVDAACTKFLEEM
ncbi:eukaryotic type KH-domain (KH-domain type I) [Annulohypoxylon maeteangense]|uniref:eukaryotic type KH-domain (KH-domain type I) n=1 Tax=Annulohypoxylon maeteangense TaxID=1927788 RepID=UPI00200853E9|nr:eukaryotic type KH-domain (KH-domain type I) [Annulohypoxylon maeteangense]KAI0881965.1 eukaryotic type KH-domain (KH-domain type I) [Annulohypoxylon maeteangense]